MVDRLLGHLEEWFLALWARRVAPIQISDRINSGRTSVVALLAQLCYHSGGCQPPEDLQLFAVALFRDRRVTLRTVIMGFGWPIKGLLDYTLSVSLETLEALSGRAPLYARQVR